MKKKEPEIIFNVHDDRELEALAKAYVQAVNARKMNSTQAKEIIAQIWREDITEPRKKENLLQMPLKETPQQKSLGKKSKNLWNITPNSIILPPSIPTINFIRNSLLKLSVQFVRCSMRKIISLKVV